MIDDGLQGYYLVKGEQQCRHIILASWTSMLYRLAALLVKLNW